MAAPDARQAPLTDGWVPIGIEGDLAIGLRPTGTQGKEWEVWLDDMPGEMGPGPIASCVGTGPTRATAVTDAVGRLQGVVAILEHVLSRPISKET